MKMGQLMHVLIGADRLNFCLALTEVLDIEAVSCSTWLVLKASITTTLYEELYWEVWRISHGTYYIYIYIYHMSHSHENGPIDACANRCRSA